MRASQQHIPAWMQGRRHYGGHRCGARPRLLTLAFFVGALLAGCANEEAPYTGRDQLILTDREALADESATFWNHTLAEYGGVSSREVNHLHDCIRRRLLAAEPRLAELNIRVGILDHDTINAFALPNGRVGVFRGLATAMPSADALAFVVAHEMAHVLNNHGAEKVSRQMVARAVAIAALTTLGAATEEEDETLRRLGVLAVNVGLPLAVLLPHSRTMEREADTVGLALMRRAGFDAESALDAISALKGGEGIAWLSSHPLKGERLARLRAQIAGFQSGASAQPATSVSAASACGLSDLRSVHAAIAGNADPKVAKLTPGTYRFETAWGETWFIVDAAGRIRGKYDWKEGRLRGELHDGTAVVRWAHAPTYRGKNTGDAEFRLVGDRIDGRWRYGDGAWQDDWDGALMPDSKVEDGDD